MSLLLLFPDKNEESCCMVHVKILMCLEKYAKHTNYVTTIKLLDQGYKYRQEDSTVLSKKKAKQNSKLIRTIQLAYFSRASN